MNPFDLFSNWYREELERNTNAIPAACCLSTAGLDGYPNARFVALKEVKDESFILTGSLQTRKGKEITMSSKIALTFWWTNTQRQVRIQGEATLLSNQMADGYFQARPMDAQIISTISKQGQALENPELLQRQFYAFERPVERAFIPRPPDWGAYMVKPIRLEFMAFKNSRFHERVLYQLDHGKWVTSLLQP
ncbi:MAG: pdxH [Flaviaesturariibacter sp.]|nr:pdxH [Flaviaesturariibacter sp.]